ncbi:hypothetical protein PoB_001250000 [Plakobranchus ocellatus]|uniref:Uncharacterized protein n=1 Tax=Plakobranchus ocellatus TaxID=259542 RepID=A0AAV3YT84_9GAST|nr:hypothetical protein PoB_001250000 [Plakobranchus ocellatus]
MTVDTGDKNKINHFCIHPHPCSNHEAHGCDPSKKERCSFCCKTLDDCKKRRETLFSSKFTKFGYIRQPYVQFYDCGFNISNSNKQPDPIKTLYIRQPYIQFYDSGFNISNSNKQPDPIRRCKRSWGRGDNCFYSALDTKTQ